MDLTGQDLSGNELNVFSVHRPLHGAMQGEATSVVDAISRVSYVGDHSRKG